MALSCDNTRGHGLLDAVIVPFEALKTGLRQLYEGDTFGCIKFRYALLALDIVTVLFIIATSFLPRNKAIESLDVVFGVLILADFAARMIISRQPLHDLARLSTWTDIVVIISFLAPLAGEAGGFLRAFRVAAAARLSDGGAPPGGQRLLPPQRGGRVCGRQSRRLHLREGVVYETQKSHNTQITNYADALYFTVTALTTTGFGDITLPGTVGRLITVVIMIFGVTLFLNLAKALLAPSKVRFPCPVCGLQRHDVDAVHCKACGTILNIPDEGMD